MVPPPQTRPPSAPHRVAAQNEYTALAGPPAQAYETVPGLGPHIVEPHRVTTFIFNHTDGAVSDSDTRYDWHVIQTTNIGNSEPFELHESAVPDSIAVVFPKVGEYEVSVFRSTLKMATSKHSLHALAKLTVHCRYVRRNLRKLLEKDRELFFDAVHTMSKVPTAVGTQLYGEMYRSLDYYARVHLERAGARKTDKMHDGMGFLTQHIAITNEFESTLQAINPIIACPYWDFTEDATRVRTSNPGDVSDLWNTELWSDSWFGNATGPLQHVTQGRWAYQTVPLAESTQTVHNPYGYSRAPWNVNKEPFVTRSHQFCDASYPVDWWPSCGTHYNATFEYTTFYDYVWSLSYDPHGPIHAFIGGYTHCGNLEKRFEKMRFHGTSALNTISLLALEIPKNFWRDHYVESPVFCSLDAPQNDCHLVCTSSADDDAFAKKIIDSMYSVAMPLAMKFSEDASVDWFGNITNDNRGDFIEALCTMNWYPGEQMEAASPIDVSFWPIHPTIERLFQYKLLVAPFEDEEWAAPEEENTRYCQYSDTSDCEGHHGYDLTAFKVYIRDDAGEFEHRYLTNGEIFQASQMSDYKLPYVYDDFSWPHCTESGYAFPLVNSMGK